MPVLPKPDAGGEISRPRRELVLPMLHWTAYADSGAELLISRCVQLNVACSEIVNADVVLPFPIFLQGFDGKCRLSCAFNSTSAHASKVASIVIFAFNSFETGQPALAWLAISANLA